MCDNCPYVYNTGQTNSDADPMGDACDICPNDGNNSCDTDSDGDGMMDSFELYYALDNPNGDEDGDGFTNLEEHDAGTNPRESGQSICPGLPVKIEGTSLYYSSLQAGYDAAVNGDSILSLYEILLGDLSVNRSIFATLRAGYGCGFITNTGTTVLNGNMRIDSGRLTIDSGRLEIE